MRIPIDGFVLSVVTVIGLAYVFPQWGLPESGIPVGIISTVGISLIFFFYGLKLSPEKVRSGIKNWKLHLLVQGSTFLFFPILLLLLRPFFLNQDGETIWLAFFFLACLPSTVSSSVVMVSIAKGNIPGAIFNASISGIIGVVVTPLWMGSFIRNTDADFDFTDIYLKLILQIIVPVVVGLLLHPYLGKFAQKYGKQLTLFDKSVILLIIYKSFAQSFQTNIFSSVSLLDMIKLF